MECYPLIRFCSTKALAFKLVTTIGVLLLVAACSSSSGNGSGGPTPVVSSAGTPTLVQHLTTPNTIVDFVSPLTVRLPNPTQSGNCLIVTIRISHAAAGSVSVSDDKANTYTAGPIITGSGEDMWMFYALDIASGTRTLNISTSGRTNPPTYTQVMASEFYNIVTANALDGLASTEITPAGTGWSAGPITTAADGDLIYMVAGDEEFIPTGFTGPWVKGPGMTFVPGGTDLVGGMVALYQIQGTQGTVTPSVTAPAAHGAVIVAVALKSASAGSQNPNSFRIQAIQHSNTAQYPPGTWQFQFSCTGNLIVNPSSMSSYAISSISDSQSNTWTRVSDTPVDEVNSQGLYVYMHYVANASTSTDMNVTYTTTGVQDGADIIFIDIVGAAASPFDTSATNSGFQASSGNLTMGTIKPAGGGEIIVAHGDHSSGTETGLTSPSVGVFQEPTWDGQDGTANLNFTLDSAFATSRSIDNSTQVFTYTRSATAAGPWRWVAAAFK